VTASPGGGSSGSPLDAPLDLGIQGRGFLVTGAAGGIGRAVCHAFAAAGANVAAVDLDQRALEGVVAALPGDGRHLALACDLADIGEHDSLLREAVEWLGRLDGLCHLAAVLRRRGTIDEITVEDWDAQIDLNLKAAFFLNRAVASHLRDAGGGSITNFTSQGWWTGGFGGSVVYAASKGGVVSMSRGLARTLAPAGIRVNTIAPGAADTEMMRGGLSEEELAKFVEMIPLGRMADPSELAGATVFLASDHARYITGATINVTGGQIMY
jgi:NAD(P)-dependent dehydrogenase (short-subunit alcohol dehydrogenase family)